MLAKTEQASNIMNQVVQNIGNAAKEIAQGIQAFGQSLGSDSMDIFNAVKDKVADVIPGQGKKDGNAKQAK